MDELTRQQAPELFELIRDAEDAIELLWEFLPQKGAMLDTGGRHMLKLKQLTYALREVRYELQAHRQALKIVVENIPLATHFRDGQKAPAVVTPRQLCYLAELVGYVEPVRCKGTTKQGLPCNSWAKKDELYCSQHLPKNLAVSQRNE